MAACLGSRTAPSTFQLYRDSRRWHLNTAVGTVATVYADLLKRCYFIDAGSLNDWRASTSLARLPSRGCLRITFIASHGI